MRRGRRIAVAALVLAGVAMPGAASAKTYQSSFQMLQVTPLGVWSETAGLPFLFKFGPTFRYSLGGNTFVGPWVAASVSRGSTSEALAEVYKDAVSRFPEGTQGVIIDRRLTVVEQTRFKVLADLYRDSDVLVVAAGHPACAGLTLAQARRIATGAVTRWSEVVAGATSDVIAVRYLQNGTDFPVPRLGTKVVGRFNKQRVNYAPAGKGAPDGGVFAAASGDQAIAAITTWSRLRGRTAGVCAVPFDGVAPTNDTIVAMQYPGAFPVSYVVTRKLAGRNALERSRIVVMRRAMKAKLATNEAKNVLRTRGLLVVGDPLPG
jgi:hypothetical protein